MKEQSRVFYTIIALIILTGLIWFVTSLSGIFTPFFMALALAYICDPVIGYLQQRGVGRLSAIIIFFLITLLLAIGMVLIVAPALFHQIEELTLRAPSYATKAVEGLQGLVDRLHNHFAEHFDLRGMIQSHLTDLRGELSGLVRNTIQRLTTKIGTIFYGIGFAAHILAALILTPIYMFFFLKDMDKVAITIQENIPPRYKIRIVRMLEEIDRSVASFFRGRFIIAIIFTALSTIGYSLCGVRYALLFGILFGVATIIPFLSFFIIIPMSVMVFLDTQSLMPLMWVWIVYGINQALEGFLFTPWILGREVTMHPVTLIMSFLVWGKLFGFLGLLLAVPITASLKIAFRELLAEPFDRLKRGL